MLGGALRSRQWLTTKPCVCVCVGGGAKGQVEGAGGSISAVSTGGLRVKGRVEGVSPTDGSLVSAFHCFSCLSCCCGGFIQPSLFGVGV